MKLLISQTLLFGPLVSGGLSLIDVKSKCVPYSYSHTHKSCRRTVSYWWDMSLTVHNSGHWTNSSIYMRVHAFWWCSTIRRHQYFICHCTNDYSMVLPDFRACRTRILNCSFVGTYWDKKIGLLLTVNVLCSSLPMGLIVIVVAKSEFLPI